jgi:hypothetical protein
MKPSRGPVLVLACLLATAVAAGVWLLRPPRNLVGETLDLEGRLLSGGMAGRELEAGIDRVIRNVDKLGREDVKKVREALRAQWLQVRQAGIDEYFAADASGREALLDRYIERLRLVRELEMAVDPRATGQPPRPRRPNGAKGKAADGDDAAKLFVIYRDALLARAAARRIRLPGHLLEPPL